MTKEETFFEIYDLIEDRLNQLGPITADAAWRICRGNTDKSYVTICNVFREVMKTMIEQGKVIQEKRGQYKILKPNNR